MSARETYQEQMRARLHELKTEIDELRHKADQAETNLQLEYCTLIDQLRLKLETANQKFQLLEEAGEENWEEFKTEFEHVWNALRELIKSVTSP